MWTSGFGRLHMACALSLQVPVGIWLWACV